MSGDPASAHGRPVRQRRIIAGPQSSNAPSRTGYAAKTTNLFDVSDETPFVTDGETGIANEHRGAGARAPRGW
jgi:hypothetical protein